MFKRILNFLYFNYYGKERGKKEPVKSCGTKSTVVENRPILETWIKETNAGLGYNKHIVFEDPAYDPTAGDMEKKYKIELCQKAQEQFKRSQNIC